MQGRQILNEDKGLSCQLVKPVMASPNNTNYTIKFVFIFLNSSYTFTICNYLPLIKFYLISLKVFYEFSN